MPLTNLLSLVAAAADTDIENKDEFTIEIIVSRTNGTVSIVVNDWGLVNVPVGGGGGILY
jgi:uncharacterized protein YjfI (DUF2170 family)